MAYLNAPMEELVYLRLKKDVAAIYIELRPECKQYLEANGNLIVRVDMSLYGLCQSGYNWNKEVENTIINTGKLHQSLGDRCLFYKQTTKGKYVFSCQTC